MDINGKKDRKDLKSYFLKNRVPSQGNFADLIDGMLNQKEDGIVKPSVNDPLCIAAAGNSSTLMKVIDFYDNFSEDIASWSLLMNPSADGNTASPKKLGLCLADGATKSPRLHIDFSTGNIGVKTVNPIAPMDIAQEPRKDSDKHPTELYGLYVTGNFGEDYNGVEFRKTDASQGIGFGYNTIYAAGSIDDQPLQIKAKGVSPVRIVGATNICDAVNDTTTDNEQFMAKGSLTIGSLFQSYGGSPASDEQWSDNTAGLLLQTIANTEIVVNEDHVRLASFMYYEGGNDFRFTLGRDMGKGTPRIRTAGDLAVNGNIFLRGSVLEAEPEGASFSIQLSAGSMDGVNNFRPELTTLVIKDQKIDFNPLRGLNTLILKPDGSLILPVKNHDVYADASSWHHWADFVNDTAKDGDIVAVVSYDAVRSAPIDGSAFTLLMNIGAYHAFGLEDSTSKKSNQDIYRIPYALLFIKDKKLSAMEACNWGNTAPVLINTTNYWLKNNPWQPISLQSKWKSFRWGHHYAQIMKDKCNVVRMRGVIWGGTSDLGMTLCILPRECWPEQRILHPVCICDSDDKVKMGRIDILPDGRVLVLNVSEKWTSLDGISFHTTPL